MLVKFELVKVPLALLHETAPPFWAALLLVKLQSDMIELILTEPIITAPPSDPWLLVKLELVIIPLAANQKIAPPCILAVFPVKVHLVKLPLLPIQ